MNVSYVHVALGEGGLGVGIGVWGVGGREGGREEGKGGGGVILISLFCKTLNSFFYHVIIGGLLKSLDQLLTCCFWLNGTGSRQVVMLFTLFSYFLK